MLSRRFWWKADARVEGLHGAQNVCRHPGQSKDDDGSSGREYPHPQPKVTTPRAILGSAPVRDHERRQPQNQRRHREKDHGEKGIHSNHAARLPREPRACKWAITVIRGN